MSVPISQIFHYFSEARPDPEERGAGGYDHGYPTADQISGSRWIAKRPDFFLPVHVLSKLFRRLMIERLVAAHAAGLRSREKASLVDDIWLQVW